MILMPWCFLLAHVAGADAQPWKTVNVWPSNAPSEKGDIGKEKLSKIEYKKGVFYHRIDNVSIPTLSIYRPSQEESNGLIVVVLPGGGYKGLTWDIEGLEIAEWLNSFGATAVLLKYRVPGRKGRKNYEAPLQDAQRAMSIVRSMAKAWGGDPKRIGVVGFSAGGHLAVALMANFNRRTYSRIDQVDEVSCRPDFATIVYPGNIINEDGSGLSPELEFPKNTPPAFIVHTLDDALADVENSILLWEELRKKKVEAELHIFPKGNHAYGVRNIDAGVSIWPELNRTWMMGVQ